MAKHPTALAGANADITLYLWDAWVAQRLSVCLWLLQVVLVKEGVILCLDNEMARVRCQQLFQRELRNEKSEHIPELLKRYLKEASPPHQHPTVVHWHWDRGA